MKGRMAMPINSAISKAVGWESRKVSFPKTAEEVRAASDEQVLEWHRFLPSAETKEQREIQNVIWDEFVRRKA